MAHLRAVPDPDDDEPVIDPASAVGAEGESDTVIGGGEQVDEEPRRYPSTIGGAFYISILLAALAALVIATRSDWRLGVQVLGGAVLVAALLRLILATRDAGMLAVRHRALDVFLLTSAGVALIVLASSIPNQPV
ncbi:MAG: DUF3017 domain-containing protein [Nocardioides sp.]